MAWIEERGNKLRVVWREGDERRGIVCHTKTEAKAVKAQIEADQHRGIYIDPNAGKITVTEWSEVWMAVRSGLKRSTAYTDEIRMRLHIVGRLGPLRLEQVTPTVVGRWVRDLETQPAPGRKTPLAPKTIRNCHALLHKMMAAAVDERIIPRNPCTKTGLPRSAKAEMHFFGSDELDRLINAAPEHYRPLFIFLPTTGFRWGEATGLGRRRVDRAAGTATVIETLTDVDYTLAIDTPKSEGSLRTVTLPQVTLDAIEPLCEGDPNGLVFVDERGDPLRRDLFRQGIWQPTLRKAELPSTARVHDLRHTHAAHLISAGVPLLAVSRRLGHASIHVTASIYGHLLPEVDERLLRAVENIVAPRVPTSDAKKEPQARAV